MAPPAPWAPSCSPSSRSAASRRARSSRSRPRARPARSSRASARAASLDDESIQGFDIALFSAGATTSREWAPKFVAAGAVVVDNSSAFRRDPEIPLVVPEVNPDALEGHKGLIANPNCSTMQLMVALKPIYDAAGIDRLIVSHLPVRLRHRREGRQGARGPDARGARRRGAAGPRGLPAPHRVQRARRRRELPRGRRPHRRRAQDDVRDAQDPRRREHQDRRHLRARAGAQLALGVRDRWRRATTSSVEEARELLANMPGLDPRRRPDARTATRPRCRRAGRDEVFVGRLRRDPTHERGLQHVGRQRQPAQGRRRPTPSRSPRSCTSAGW